MNYCDKVKDLESRIKVLEDKVFKMNLNQKKDECTIQTNKEPGETKTLYEIAKMFKRGWLCKDERCVMWVPHRPEGFPLWNRQKDGVELNVKIESNQVHDKNRACYIDCKTGKEFSKVLLKDVEFHYHNKFGTRTFTSDQLIDPDDHFVWKPVGCCFTADVTIKGDNTLLDDETLKHLIYELKTTNKEWLARKGSAPGTIVLIKI